MSNSESGGRKGLKCSNCGRRLSLRDKGLKWEKCQICDKAICFDCTYYIRSKVKGMFRGYYYDVIRVCKDCKV